ncbi:MAG: hypothetical protein WCL04_06830 [Verrucomicrobiota bacterium]
MRETVAADSDGGIIFSDRGAIKKLTVNGALAVLAGRSDTTGYRDGRREDARFSPRIRGLVVDRAGNIYVSDTENNVIRKISREGEVLVVAGTGQAGYVDGSAAAAAFNQPRGLTVDAQGNLYVADTLNHVIRKITFAPNAESNSLLGYVSGTRVTTLAGSAGHAGLTDGPVAKALFNQPTAVAIDADGNVFVADSGNSMIRRIFKSGAVTTLAGRFESPAPGVTVPEFASLPPRAGIGSEARVGGLTAISVDKNGVIYIVTGGNIMTGIRLDGGTGRLWGNAGFSAGSGAINPLLPGGAIPNSDTGVTTNNAVLHLGETNAIKGGNGLTVYGGTLSLGTFSLTLRTATLSTGTSGGDRSARPAWRN